MRLIRQRALLALGICVVAVGCDWMMKHLLLDPLGWYTIFNDSPANVWLIAPLFVVGGTLLCLRPSAGCAVGVGLTWGGVVGNLLDRSLFGPVADFISFPHDPTLYYNLADLFIGAGLSVAAVSYVWGYLRERSQIRQQASL